MALTVDFEGLSGLPDGWSFDSPEVSGATGSYEVADGRVSITLPSGTSFDAPSTGGSAENSAGIVHAIPDHDGAVSVAVRVDSDMSCTKGVGVNLLVKGPAAEVARAAWHHANNDNQAPNLYGYARNSEGGSTLQAQQVITTYQSGVPAWLRLDYNPETGAWSILDSADGATWRTAMTGTRAFTPTLFKAGFTSTTPALGGTWRIGRVVDLLDTGSDVRGPAPERIRARTATIDGTETALPAGWVDDSIGGATVTFTGTAVRLTSQASQPSPEGISARVRWDGTGLTNWGLIMRAQVVADNPNCYLVPGVMVPHEDWPDQYVAGHGHALEVQLGAIRRPIRVDDIRDTTVAVPANPPTGLDERRYCWLANLTAQYDMGDGAPRWFQMERYGPRVRYREWADAEEPSGWSMFDGEDAVYWGDEALPTVALSQNSGATGSDAVVDITDLAFYEPAPPSGLKVRDGDDWREVPVRHRTPTGWGFAAVKRRSGDSWV